MPSPRRTKIALIALALLCGLLTWRASQRLTRRPAVALGEPAARTSVPASVVPPAVPPAAAPRIPGRDKWLATEILAPGERPRIADGKVTNRFRNTAATLDELVRNDRAILLRNALVDTATGTPLPLPAGLQADAESGAYVVQAVGALDGSFRRRLQTAGLEVVSYIPNNAYLVRGTRATMEQVAESPEVAAVLPYAPAFKLEPDLLDEVLAGRSDGERKLIVTLPNPDDTLPGILDMGGREEFRERGPFGTLMTVVLPPGRLTALAALPGVQMIERWMGRELANDLAGPVLGSVTNLDNTGSYEGLTGEGVLINLNDSGVDATHPDLKDRVSTISNLAATVLVDRNGHGTHVAGTIAGDGTASAQIAGTPQGSTNTANFQGRAPKAKLFVLPVDLIQGPPSGDSYLQEEAARAPGRTSRNRPLISNNSWGYLTREYTSKSASYDAAVRDALPGESGNQPILYVFSAGNEGLGGNSGVGGVPDSIASPGNAKNVITVGALESLRNLTNSIVYDTNGLAVKIGSQIIPGRGYDPTNTTYFTNEVLKPFTDTSHQVAAYSSRGNVGVEIEGESGRFKPDVVAPGSFILSARSAAWRLEDQYAPGDDQFLLFDELERTNEPYYRFESGTSMSAPAISGLLAQMQQFFEQREDLFPSAASYKAMLINSAQVTSETYQPDPKETFNYAGWGLPTLPRALRSGLRVPSADKELAYIEFSRGLATHEVASYPLKLNASNTGALRVTLVWTDPPGNPAASTKLVNDLDLMVSNTVTGEIFWGNGFAPGTGLSVAQSTNNPILPDRVNNVERVVVAPPVVGDLVVYVVAHRVNVNAVWTNPDQIAQDFSVAMALDVDEGVNGGELLSPEFVDPAILGLDAPTDPMPITNGVAVFNLKAGAHSPLVGDQRGTTNQWRFFIFTNIAGTTTNGDLVRTNGSNVAFVIFPSLPDANLSRTRTNGPDLDLYVSRDSGLLTLSPGAVSAALKSRSSEATELVAITNSPLGDDVVYYVGVKSEDQQSGEFAFFGISTDQPFTSFDENGFPHPFTTQLRPLSDGSPSSPGVGQWIAISLINDELRRVVPQVRLSHENFADLFGQLQLRSTFAVLNNHGPIRDLESGLNVDVLYDDSGSGDYSDTSFTRPSDGPGSLSEFMGRNGGGPWFYTLVDNALGSTGSIRNLDIRLMPNDFGPQFVERCVRARQIELEVINVPADASRLTITVTNRQNETLDGPLEVYVRREAFPDIANPTNNDKFATILPPNGGDLVISLRDVPPLTAGRYFVAVYNPNGYEVCYRIRARLDRGSDGDLTKVFGSGIINQRVTDQAVTYSSVNVDDSRPVTAIGAGLRLEHPRLSDLSIRLINPQGGSTMLVENRGRTDATAFGEELITTNGEFAHVAVTFERTAGRAQIFVNGNKVGEQNFLGTLPDTTNSLYFGTDGERRNAGPIVVDDFGLWKRVLTSDNIRDLYRYGVEDSRGKDVSDSGAGLLAFWPFNGNGAEQVDGKDVVFAGASGVPGLLGQGMQIAGGGAGRVAPPEAGQPLDVIRNVGFTLEGWVKLDTNTPAIIAGWSGTNGHTGPLLLANYLPPLGNGPGSFSVAFLPLDQALQQTPVALDNAGFEELVGSDVNHFGADNRLLIGHYSVSPGPAADTNGFVSAAAVPGWSVVGTGGTINQTSTAQFTNDVPEGQDCAWLATGHLSQVNAALYEADRRYRLSVAVGVASSVPSPGYRVGLYAGGAALGEDSGATALSVGEFVEVVVETVVTNGSPAVGQPIELRLGTPAAVPGQVFFDRVRLSVAPDLSGSSNLAEFVLSTPSGLATPGGTVTNTIFAVFTELTNITSEPIKFAVPPFVTDTRTRLLAASTFDIPRTGDQFFSVGELVDGWTVISNTVQWDYFPEDALTGNSCIELFPNLGGGIGSRIRRVFPTTPGRFYTLSTGYRRVPNSSGPASQVDVYADGTLVSSFFGAEGWQTNASLVQATGSSLTFEIANSAGGASTTAVARATAVVESGRIARVDITDGGAGYVTPPAVRFQTIGFPAGGRSATAVATIENGVVTQIRVVNPGTNYSTANPPRVVIAAPPVAPKPAETFLDEIRFVEEPSGLYVPEEPLRPLASGPALGQWSLEVTDSRSGEVGEILQWQMQLTFVPTNPPAYRLTPGVSLTTNVTGNSFTYFIVEVPPEVYSTTNTLVSVSGGPVNLVYSQTGLPDGLQLDDYYLLNGVTDIPQFAVLQTNVLPELKPGQRYYLGVQNAVPSQDNTFTIRVDFGLPITPLTNNVPLTAANANRGFIDYYSFDVTPGALGVRFSLSNLGGDVNLVVSRAPELPTRTVYDYASTNIGRINESIQIDPYSEPVPLTSGLWYLGVYPADPNPTNVLSYRINASEVFGNTAVISNGVPITDTITNVGVVNYYYLDITEEAQSATFALTNVVGNVDLYLRKGVPLPTDISFDYASTNSGNADELIYLQGDRVPELLTPGRWFMAVVPKGPVPVSFTVVASYQVVNIDVLFLIDSVPEISSVPPGPANVLYRFDVPSNVTTRLLFEVYDLSENVDLLVSKDTPPDQNPTVISNIKPGLQNELVVATDSQFPQLGGTWYLQVRIPATTNATVDYTVRASSRQDGLLISAAPLVVTYNLPTAGGQTPFLQWNAIPGELYQIQSTTDLSRSPVVWSPVIPPAVSPTENGIGFVPFVDSNVFPTLYYRVIQLPNP